MPTKEKVCHYMHQRQVEKISPPSAEEMRQRLGWNLIQESHNNGKSKK